MFFIKLLCILQVIMHINECITTSIVACCERKTVRDTVLSKYSYETESNNFDTDSDVAI